MNGMRDDQEDGISDGTTDPLTWRDMRVAEFANNFENAAG
jgi:hypothetical protein